MVVMKGVRKNELNALKGVVAFGSTSTAEQTVYPRLRYDIKG